MEEKKPQASDAAAYVALIVIVAVVVLCMSFCSGKSDSGKSSSTSGDTAALVACKRYAKSYFPYGFKYSTFDTNITEIDGRTRVTFFDAKVGNAYGAERTTTVHCDVVGDSVVSFDAL